MKGEFRIGEKYVSHYNICNMRILLSFFSYMELWLINGINHISNTQYTVFYNVFVYTNNIFKFLKQQIVINQSHFQIP